MNIAEILSKKTRLMEAHSTATAQEFIACANGELSEDELHRRHAKRLGEMAALDQSGQEWTKAIESEKRSESLKKKRLRWHRFTDWLWRSAPYYRDIDFTKAEKAVIAAYMAVSGGRKVFRVANEYIAAKSGASLSTVKRTVRRLVSEGLLYRRERRVKGKAYNFWNEYTLQCDKLLAWAVKHFGSTGVKSEPHPLTGDFSVATGGQITSTEASEVLVESCRHKANRSLRVEAPEALDPETFELVAKAALQEIGEPVEDGAAEDGIIKTIELLKEREQPDYQPYFWQKAITRHGRRRAALAFLEVHMVDRMRRLPVPDKRPWNERELIQDRNRYLSAILKRSVDGPLACRPEITVGAILHAKGIYDLPTGLVRAVRSHNRDREGVKRWQSSAA